MRFRSLTLIETLVVLAVLAMLTGLFVSAVQAGRETFRRVRCASNLKQIGPGLHSYHSAIKAPPWGDGPDDWNEWSAMILILPYLDESALYNATNFAWGQANPALPPNTTVQRSTLSLAAWA